MKTRRSWVDILYNGVAVTTAMQAYMNSVAYTDPASGSADSLDISINDRGGQWLTAWLPVLGDTITATINAEAWESENDDRQLYCGFFIVDVFSFAGNPVTGTISAVSSPADGGFMTTERSATWESVTIQEVAKEKAATAGIELVWDVEGFDFILNYLEQSNQTDSAFLCGLCTTYGLAMKIYAQKIVIYEREAYKAKDPVQTIDAAQLSWSIEKSTTGTYTGGVYAYTDPTTEEEISVTEGDGTRILNLSGDAESQADAQRKLVAAIQDANHSAVTLTASMKGTANLVASQCVTVTGLGGFSGTYYIDSITHNLGSGGYTMDLSMVLVSDKTVEVIEDAITRLYAVGVIDTPSYWVANYTAINSLGGLLLNMATIIKTNKGGSSITTVADALVVLATAGVTNSPDYWAANYGALAYVDLLLIKAANALTE